jgi:tetratricopeptide (TPR) repeat protein
MGDDSVNIDNIKGKVSGVSYGSTGSLTADVIRIEGNLTININNPTKEVVAELLKIREVPIAASETKDQATTQKVKETRKSIDLFKNLLSQADEKVGAPTQSIRAGNVEVSRNELFLKDAGTMAYEYGQKGDYHNALVWSDKAIQIDPNDAITWYNKGVALGRLGRDEEAIRSYDRAIQIDPNYGDAWDNKGIALTNLGRYDEAIKSFDRAIQLGTTNGAITWYNKGVALGRLNRYSEAIQYFDRAIQIDPNNAFAWDNKAWALNELGRYNEAIQCIDRAIQIDPNYARAWYRKGWNLQKLGRYGEAEQYFTKARQLGYKT